MPVPLIVPDLGDFAAVEVIDVMIQSGAEIEPEQGVITVESDKASMDIPASVGGRVVEVRVAVGDTVSAGDVIALLAESGATKRSQSSAKTEAMTSTAMPAGKTIRADLAVLGSGPGGYAAAFRAADLGLNTVLIERHRTLGGVCLNVGCIPSKALLHATKVISDVREIQDCGIEFGPPRIDRRKLKGWKDSVVEQLTGGLQALAKQRKVRIVHGAGEFDSANAFRVATAAGDVRVEFMQAVIAAGSVPATLPFLPDDERIFDSTGALELGSIPERLLVIGGGIIGLEMAAVYHELGTRITVVEVLDNLIPGADSDIVRPLQERIKKQYENIFLGTRVTAVSAATAHLEVKFEGGRAPGSDIFDGILVAVGRQPNGRRLNAEHAGVIVDERGFIPVDEQQRTNLPHIFAIGDIVGQPMLAHKASHEGKVAAEVAAGLKSAFAARVIPSVAYTDPEVAWVGVTEAEAEDRGISYEKSSFPWAASGRALSLGRSEGVTKLLFDADSNRIIGAGVVGPNAGDLIAEAALAIEMGCEAEDIGLTVHPHPTLSETIAMAAETFSGTVTDLYVPKKHS